MNTEQTEIFPPSGEALKEQGTAQVLGHNEAWSVKAMETIKWLAFSRDRTAFTSDDVRDVFKMALVSDPSHRNCWGSLLSHAAKQGLIVRVGYRVSRRSEAHGRVVSVWRGK